MKDIFLCLLMNLKNHGKITSASMYDETCTSIKLKDDEYEYDVSITRKPLQESIRNDE